MQGGSRRRWPIRRRGHDFEPLLPFIWSPQSPCHCEPSCAVIPGARLCHFRRCLCLSFERFASLSFGAQREIFVRKPRFLRRSPSPSLETGSFEMTKDWIASQTKGVFRPTRTHGVAVGYHNTAPQERGSKPRSPQRGVEWFRRGERLLALRLRICCTGRCVAARIQQCTIVFKSYHDIASLRSQ